MKLHHVTDAETARVFLSDGAPAGTRWIEDGASAVIQEEKRKMADFGDEPVVLTGEFPDSGDETLAPDYDAIADASEGLRTLEAAARWSERRGGTWRDSLKDFRSVVARLPVPASRLTPQEA